MLYCLFVWLAVWPLPEDRKKEGHFRYSERAQRPRPRDAQGRRRQPYRVLVNRCVVDRKPPGVLESAVYHLAIGSDHAQCDRLCG